MGRRSAAQAATVTHIPGRLRLVVVLLLLLQLCRWHRRATNTLEQLWQAREICYDWQCDRKRWPSECHEDKHPVEDLSIGQEGRSKREVYRGRSKTARSRSRQANTHVFVKGGGVRLLVDADPDDKCSQEHEDELPLRQLAQPVVRCFRELCACALLALHSVKGTEGRAHGYPAQHIPAAESHTASSIPKPEAERRELGLVFPAR